jgi:hypothetical protein
VSTCRLVLLYVYLSAYHGRAQKHASGKRKGHLEWVRMYIQKFSYPCVYLP